MSASQETSSALSIEEPWIVDAHTHVLPERLARKIRAFFIAIIAQVDGEGAAGDSAPSPSAGASASAPGDSGAGNASAPASSADAAAAAAAAAFEAAGAPGAQGGGHTLACCPPASALDLDFDAAYDDASAFPAPSRLVFPYHESDAGLLAGALRDAGVKGSWVLPYAHKPGVAGPLNEAILSVCASLRSHGQAAVAGLTAHPGDGPAVGAYVKEAIAAGARVAKLHCSVGSYSVLHPSLVPFWDAVAYARVPVVVHAGTHVSGHTASPEMRDIEGVAKRWPDARIVIAHAGSPAVKAALGVAERCSNVYLDTTPTVTRLPLFPPPGHPSHASLLALARAGRVLFGSDVPNVALPLEAQLAGVAALFGTDADRKALDAGRDWRTLGVRERGEGEPLAEVLRFAAERLVREVRSEGRKAGL